MELRERPHPPPAERSAPEAQGRGLGSWLLRVVLHEAWQSNPQRIWLHTDNWDHASAVKIYEPAGFKIYDLREEESGPL
jgi:ribosomal protein S18 acetylase RimI-like enzyme